MDTSIWYEKYKPQTLDELILPQKIKETLKEQIQTDTLPNLGLWSVMPGLGKSSTANVIIHDLKAEALWINASLEKGIDVIRSKIQTFASHASFNGANKIVVMDECLDENEKVILIKDNEEIPTALKNLEKDKVYDCLSFNLQTGIYENDTCKVISDKVDNIYKLILNSGKVIFLTANHPLIVKENDQFVEKSIEQGLNHYDLIVVRDLSKTDRYRLERVASISLAKTGRVINLNVHKNHTFVTVYGITVHNCDHLTPDAQAAFRGFLDEYSENTRFIFTGNYKNKIIEPLVDRLQNYDYAEFDAKEIIPQLLERINYICKQEDFKISKGEIGEIIKQNYPKIRSIIGELQRLKLGISAVITDKYDLILDAANTKNYRAMYKEIMNLNDPDALYSYLFKHPDLLKADLPKVVLTLAKYQGLASQVRDKHLNLAACLTEMLF